MDSYTKMSETERERKRGEERNGILKQKLIKNLAARPYEHQHRHETQI